MFDRLLLHISVCYLLFILSLNAFSAGYNYVHYRFDWSPFQISIFFAVFNSTLALSSGLVTRLLVPRLMSEEHGALLGTFIQVRVWRTAAPDARASGSRRI